MAEPAWFAGEITAMVHRAIKRPPTAAEMVETLRRERGIDFYGIERAANFYRKEAMRLKKQEVDVVNKRCGQIRKTIFRKKMLFPSRKIS